MRKIAYSVFAVLLMSLQLATTQEVKKNDAEVKLIVPEALTTEARKLLKLADTKPEPATICFFDTADLQLQKAGVILRIRKKGDEAAEATVKTTYPDQDAAAAEKHPKLKDVKLEEDWTTARKPRLSRSIDMKGLAKEVVEQLKTGNIVAEKAVAASLQDIVNHRVPGLKWGNVKCFGPASADIWKDVELPDLDKKITVEEWKLVKPDGVTKDNIFEISAKRKDKSPEEIAAFIDKFFQAAENQKLMEPAADSKTKRVLKFFEPGK